MPHRDFILFILPSLLAMMLFIAFPIVSVLVQSLYVEHDQVMIVVENCNPFGCEKETVIDVEATAKLKEEEPLGKFNGLGTYINRSHLAFAEVAEAWRSTDSFSAFMVKLYDLPFYKALFFTLVYTFFVTPFSIVLGLLIALAVNTLPRLFKGPTIFVSLLPMIVTPLIGSLILFWMIDADGIIGATLQYLYDDTSLSLKASPILTWATLIFYGIWHQTPFPFIVFYAGLQTVSQEVLQAAMIDGASRWKRVWHVTVPHLMPLVTFCALIMLMDNFRVFEPIVGFSASANATSLSWIIFNDLRGQETPLFGSAAATSMLTIIGVIILLKPVLLRTWQDFKSKTA